MQTVSRELVERAARQLADTTLSDEEREREVLGLAGHAELARRLIDLIPEAFGLVLIGHMNLVELPRTFSARASDGSWHEFPFSADPIFAMAAELATDTYHHGPRDLFVPLAASSSMVDAVNSALNAGADPKGALLSGPALNGVPAETYLTA